MKRLLKKRLLIPLVLGLIALALLSLRGDKDLEASLQHQVARGNFIISVVEGGTLEAVKKVVIKNTIDGESRIISLIPEGTYVEEGDLLVEFDTGEAENKVEQQRVDFQTRQSALVEAENSLLITKSSAASDISAAELEVKFATMDLKKFEQLERVQTIREAELKIDTARETLKLAEQGYDWSVKLSEKGFETQSKVDQDRLDVSKASKELESAESGHAILQAFDLEKQYAEKKSDLKEATASLERIKTQSESRIRQGESALNSARVTLKLKEASLAKSLEQLAATKVRAPQAGLVIYAKPRNRWNNEQQVAEGALMRNRASLISLPDISEMKVTVKIHESMVSQVKQGQKAYITLDSLPDRRFQGEVSKVAIIPDSNRSWSNPDLKVYTTEVIINDLIEGIKPGVSAKVEIIIEELADVLTVPIQAVTTLDGEQVCYRQNGSELEPIPVEIGRFNTKYIEIKSGLKEGQEIVLNPPLDQRINLTGEAAESEAPE